MKIYFVFTVLFAVFHLNSAAVAQSGPSTHKDFPNQCYVASDKKGYAVGTHTPIGVCKQINCSSNFSYSIFTCGTVGVPPGYHNERDLTKPYPHCCIKIVKD